MASAIAVFISTPSQPNSIATAASLAVPTPASSATPAPYYLRMTLLDKPGALAKIATCLGDSGISINQMRQLHRPGDRAEDAVVLIVTHKASPADVADALSRFQTTSVLVGQPVAIRIEEV